MPRKRPIDRVGPVKTRSRGSCKECRSSRVRCDTKKPVCTRCQEKGLSCSTQLVLKWESEYTSRGLAFGRSGVWSKSSGSLPTSPSRPEIQEWCPVPTVQPWGFVNSGVSTYGDPHQVDLVCDDLEVVVSNYGMKGNNGSLTLSPIEDPAPYQHVPNLEYSLSLFPDVSGGGRFFEYYFQQVCPRTTASSQQSSPFASVVLPFCLSASPTLFKAIEALGACHWSRFDSTYKAVGLRSKSQVLRDLRCRLTTQGPSTCSTDPEVLVIMMMLCLYEIVDNCDHHWTIHLKGAKELIKMRRQQQLSLPSSHTPDSVSVFAERFFAFQDVMGRTACGEEVVFGSDYWQESERNIDPWMGCSPELVSVLSSITELSRTRRHLTSDLSRSSFSMRAASLEHKLERLVQSIDGDDETLRSAAELKHLAAVLYLHCALYGASPSTPLVVDYVRRILSITSTLLDSGSLASVTWPVFVAAVELDPVHDELWSDGDSETMAYGRPLVLRALAAMAESTVSNVARTRAVITKVWQARDLDMLKSSTVDALDHPTSCNDWERYVAPISTAMSLA